MMRRKVVVHSHDASALMFRWVTDRSCYSKYVESEGNILHGIHVFRMKVQSMCACPQPLKERIKTIINRRRIYTRRNASCTTAERVEDIVLGIAT